MKKRISEIIMLILSILLILTPRLIAHDCMGLVDGKPMKCHWMGNAVMTVAGLMILFSIAMLITKSLEKRKAYTFAILVNAIAAILLAQFIIGGCMKETMSCRTNTIPTIFLISGLTIIASIINYFLLTKEGKKIKNYER